MLIYLLLGIIVSMFCYIAFTDCCDISNPQIKEALFSMIWIVPMLGLILWELLYASYMYTRFKVLARSTHTYTTKSGEVVLVEWSAPILPSKQLFDTAADVITSVENWNSNGYLGITGECSVLSDD